MCEGMHGMNMKAKEGPRTYDILFEFAGDRYFVSIRSTGNIWKSLIDHDLNNRDRLCDLITYDNIISVNGEWSASEFIEGWDDILEKNQRYWDFKDCAIEYMERNGYCWFELHPIVDGVEREVRPGDVVTMAAGCRHTVIAETELKMIEVQLGEDINIRDKQKFDLEY